MVRWLPALPVFLVPIAILVISSFWKMGWPKIEPYPWVGVAAAVGLAGWAALWGERRRWLDLGVVVLLAVAAGNLFVLLPGFPRGHDITTHLWGIWGFFKAILDGDLYPRWLHHLGMGMPLIQFYPPVSFFLLLPFLALDLPPYDALKYGFILYSALAGLSMYWVVNRETGDRRAALVAAAAYAWSPYMLMDSHYRVALAEGAGFIFAPFFFHFGMAAVRSPSRRTVAWAALWAALLIVTHPLSASMACTGIGVWITAEYWPRRVGWRPWMRRLGSFAVVGVAALLVAGFYTVPLAAEARYATIEQALGGGMRPLFTQHGLRPVQLLEPRRWATWQMSETTGSEKDKKGQEQPFYFGLALLALLPLAASGRREPGAVPAPAEEAPPAEGVPPVSSAGPPGAPPGLLWLTVAGLVFSLRPLDQVLGFVPNFTMLQFPWRFLWLGTVGAAWCAGYATVRLIHLARSLPKGAALARLAPGVLGAILIFDGFPYSGAASWGPAYDGVVDQVYSAKACKENVDCWENRPVDTREVPLRAEGTFFFPPADYDIELSLFKRVYPEYQTDAVRKAFYSRAKDDKLDTVLAEVAVGWSFSGNGKKPRLIKDPSPYAEFRGEGGVIETLAYTRKAGTITVQLPKKAGQVVVKEQYFPGWMVETDHGPQDVNPSKQGLIQLRVGANQEEVHFYFSELRGDRFLGWLISAVTLLALFWPMRRTPTPAEA